MSPKPDHIDGLYRARIPADIDAPDRIAFGLTFRQLAIIGAAATVGWLTYHAFGTLVPAVVWLIAVIPAAATTIVVALGRRDGLPLDVWLRHGVTLARAPKVYTPGSGASGPGLAMVAGKPVVPAPLRLTATAISPAGVLTTAGTDRMMVACGTTNVHLRTGMEQAALLDGFGRWLNALTAPAQIVVAAHRHDLTPYADAIARSAHRLPYPALQTAARDYATYLTDLDATRDPLRRQVLAVVTGEHARDTGVRALTGVGVTATVLDGPAVTAALAAAVDPYAPPVPGGRAVPGAPITLRRPQ